MKLRNLRIGPCLKTSVLGGEEGEVALIADVESEKFNIDTIWFSVPRKYETWLTKDRYDGFLVALLYPAMAYGENIEIDGTVSERLYQNVKECVIPILLVYSPNLKKINISVKETTDKIIETATHIGTGFSGGVDSFCTIYDKFVLETNPKYKIDILTNINVGNYYGYRSMETDVLFQRAFDRLSGFPSYVGLPYIPVNSKLAYIYGEKWSFMQVHLLYTIAGILSMQNCFTKYYFASALSFAEIPYYAKNYVNYGIAGFCDVYILQFLSTESLSIIPNGQQYTRAEKTERISHYSPTYDFLEVSPRDSTGKQDVFRPKCIRTLTSLDSLDKLELYSKIFDLERYRKNRFYIRCQQVLDYKKDPYVTDNIDFARLHGKKFPSYCIAFIVCLPKNVLKVLSRILGKKLTAKIRTMLKMKDKFDYFSMISQENQR